MREGPDGRHMIAAGLAGLTNKLQCREFFLTRDFLLGKNRLRSGRINVTGEAG